MGLGAAFRLSLCSLSHERILGRTPQPSESRDFYGGFDGRRVPEANMGILDARPVAMPALRSRQIACAKGRKVVS